MRWVTFGDRVCPVFLRYRTFIQTSTREVAVWFVLTTAYSSPDFWREVFGGKIITCFGDSATVPRQHLPNKASNTLQDEIMERHLAACKPNSLTAPWFMIYAFPEAARAVAMGCGQRGFRMNLSNLQQKIKIGGAWFVCVPCPSRDCFFNFQ